MNNKVAILVSSYDGAQDLWLPVSQSYEKYWSDCPYKIYLGTNFKDPNLSIFEALKIGNENSWSDNLFKCLNKIKEEYIILIFDDVFLYKKINTEKITSIVDEAVIKNWSYLRLSPRPKFDRYVSKNIGIINKNRLYRTSTAWALFKKDVLIDLLDKKESAWDFEIKGSERSNKYNDFYSVDVEILPYLNGVVKGKWVNKVYRHLKKENFDVSDKNIKKMNFYESILFEFIKIRSYFFEYLVPKSLKLPIRKMFYK